MACRIQLALEISTRKARLYWGDATCCGGRHAGHYSQLVGLETRDTLKRTFFSPRQSPQERYQRQVLSTAV